MKNLKQSQQTVRQNGELAKSSKKHDANLQKNSMLYFQVGLIICLLTAYGILEMRFKSQPVKIPEMAVNLNNDILYSMPDIKVYKEPEVKPVEPKSEEPKQITDEVLIDDNPLLENPDVETPDSTTGDSNIDLGDLEPEKPVDNDEPLIFIAVEFVPVFPGCESEPSREAKMACFEQSISSFINNKFNKNIASRYGLEGVQKIHVQFKVDKTGEITDVKTRAPHPALEKEALRVIEKLPKMTPGMQRDIPVSVIYTVPIIFQVVN